MKKHHNTFETLGHSGASRWSGANSETSNTTSTNSRHDRFRCISCDERFEDDVDAVSLYECHFCGIQFTQETSANLNNQCPDCYKFAEKVTDLGCPDCNEGELVEIEQKPETTVSGGPEPA